MSTWSQFTQDDEESIEVQMETEGTGVHSSEEEREDQQNSSRKFPTYDLQVDPHQDDRASEIKLCSFKRPHMRAFHYAWWSYHVAFLLWFSITPLLSEIQDDLSISTQDVWTSSIAAGTSTLVMRFAMGPFCDKYGPRIPMGIILLCSAIPTGLTGLVNSATGLSVLRFFIGVGGSAFVMAQYWASAMFTKEWVGTASATVGGWGNLGGGVTQIMMGSLLFPLFTHIYDGDSEKAWRTIFVFPAAIGLITSFCVIRFTDDCPRGNYSKLKKQDQKQDQLQSFRRGAMDINTWLLFIQYACCAGVEITMYNAGALYFKDEFGLTTETAGAIASIFGWMNLFARTTGGYVSDRCNRRWAMRGRLAWQSFVLLLEGLLVILFAFCTNLAAAIVVLVFFAIFVQASEGSTYGIVPYVNPPITGSISGIIGAGGNVGSVVFSLFFRQLSYQNAYTFMGIVIACSSILSTVIFIGGHPGLVWRTSVITKPLDGSSNRDVEADGGQPVKLKRFDTKSSSAGSYSGSEES